MTRSLVSVGIDVAKLKLDVRWRRSDKQQHSATFPNDQLGFEQLLDWVKKWEEDDVHFCLESTGIYSADIAAFLYLHQQRVSVINPRVISDYRKSLNIRSKNDQRDAYVLAYYASEREPYAYVPSSEVVQELRELVSQREIFQRMYRQTANRLKESTRNPRQREREERTLAHLKEQEDEILVDIKALIQEDKMLKSTAKHVQTIVGMGAKSTAYVIAFVGDLDRFRSSGALVNYVGLSVVEHQSGTSVNKKPHIDGQGRAQLRKMLYMCAISAKRFDPDMKAWAATLAAKGKAKKVVIVAVMRKLLHIIYGVWKHQKDYDPSQAFPQAAQAA